MSIPGFYNFIPGGRGDPMVTMLMAAIPVVAADVGGHTATNIPRSNAELENLVLVYHLFLKEHDPLCVIVPSRK